MRAKYSIALAGVLVAGAALAAPCPPALTAVAGEVARLRSVPPPFAPPCRLVAAGDLRGILDRKLRRDLPVTPEVYLQALYRVGFTDEAGAAVWDRLLAFYASQVLGFYEPETDEMVIVDSPAAQRVEGEMVWAHELAHAAQEHRFRLPSHMMAMRGDGDRQRAASAVAEGEAMLVMFLAGPAGDDAEALAGVAATVAKQAQAMAFPSDVPAYFVADLVFPYSNGFSTALAAYRAGGWPAVDRLLAHPPATTAALLHPDRPAAGTVPAGELLPAPDGWEDVLTDTVGEWGVAFLLARHLGDPEADEVASGWDGDRIRLIRERAHPERWALDWRVRCRTEAARAALESAMQRALPPYLLRLEPGGQPRLTWVAAGRTVELRAAWPRPSPPRRPPS